MEIHIRTLVFLLLSLLGSLSVPFLARSLPEGATADSPMQTLPTPTPVPLRGLSTRTQDLAQQLRPPDSSPTAETVPNVLQAVATVRTNGANLNIRGGPGLDRALVGSAPPGTLLRVTGISPDRQWLRVDLPGGSGRGWVFAALTDLDAAAASLPIVEEE